EDVVRSREEELGGARSLRQNWSVRTRPLRSAEGAAHCLAYRASLSDALTRIASFQQPPRLSLSELSHYPGRLNFWAVTRCDLHSGFWLENKLNSFGFAGANGDLLSRRAEFFMPGFERVGARRQIAQIKAAVLPCHHKVRMLEYGDVAFHPRMHIALHG